MSVEEQLLPNYAKLEPALRSIGYSFENAVADIIDNSIDAGAKTVLVRVVCREDGQIDLVIWDDGSGMDSKTMRRAMQFGSDVTSEIDRLGKFGLGLKLASLSQAHELRVITAKDGELAGRAWLKNSIAQGFRSTLFSQEECANLLAEIVPDHNLHPSGTVVWWSGLYRFHWAGGNIEEHAQKLLRKLEVSLPLTFHRFLARGATGISLLLDIFDAASLRPGIPNAPDPLNPFGYDASGNADFPTQLLLDGDYGKLMKIKAHIWPPNSTAPEYRLPGGANSRQGFYFYRKDRLIQAGGWNGLREVESHSSLARLEIDIETGLDTILSLDVKKVEVHLPPDVAAAIQRAKTPSGIDFKKYMSIANDAYRKRTITNSELPLIPSEGLPAQLVKFLHHELRLQRTAKHRDLKIIWKWLEEEQFFDIDRDSGHLYLNKMYRSQLQHGLRGSSADIPVLKCLLFLLLQDALSSERTSAKIRENLDRVNRILVAAVKYERSQD